jgi:hypothetical protein
MPLRPSTPEIKWRDVESLQLAEKPELIKGKVEYVVYIDGQPVRYYDTRKEADAFVDGFEYVWVRD